LLALGYISFMIRNNLNLSSRKVVLQGLLVLYLLLAQGSTHVLANPNTKWSAAPGYALLALQLSFAGLCGYFGLIANEVPPHTARP
jgi:hypothetical protein